MSESQPLLMIDLEVGTTFKPDDLREEASRSDIDFGVSSGLNADRILKFITDLNASTLEAIRSLVLRAIGVGEVKGVKISLDGVEIGSVQSADLTELRSTITQTLDELARHKRVQE
jgi:hypothetical protein